VILVGQLNLNPLLKAPQMRQLDQRVVDPVSTASAEPRRGRGVRLARLTVAGGSAR
jgi:hypothetical protein